MNTTKLFAVALAAAILSGCARASKQLVMTTPEYGEKPRIATSLFPSDQAVLGDEAIARILSSKLELPAKGKLALMGFPDGERCGSRYYGSFYLGGGGFVEILKVRGGAFTNAVVGPWTVLEGGPLA